MTPEDIARLTERPSVDDWERDARLRGRLLAWRVAGSVARVAVALRDDATERRLRELRREDDVQPA